MRRYLLDSNALNCVVHDLRGVRRRVGDAQSRGAVIGTGMPVVAEILGGVELSSTRDRNRPIVYRALKQLRIWPFDLNAAKEYARLYAEMRRRGDTVQVVDLMIAAIARTFSDCHWHQ